ncbi:hypothetical protein, partial [Clostridium perfringens]
IWVAIEIAYIFHEIHRTTIDQRALTNGALRNTVNKPKLPRFEASEKRLRLSAALAARDIDG